MSGAYPRVSPQLCESLDGMASGYFQLQDFYVAGGGCDLGGTLLLARGLINRPAELTRLSGSFYASNAYQAVSVAKNRLDALVGIIGLGVGFTLAVVGYLAALATAHPLRTGTGEVLVGAAVALLALALTLVLGHLYRRSRLLPLLIEMSRFAMHEQHMEFPRAALLPRWLEALGPHPSSRTLLLTSVEERKLVEVDGLITGSAAAHPAFAVRAEVRKPRCVGYRQRSSPRLT